MQDDWRAVITDPDLNQYTPFTIAELRKYHPWLYTGEHDFEFFERAMLCVADDGYWAANAREPWINIGGSIGTTWICRWRRRLGRPVVAGIDDDPGFHSPVWRDNWQAVRDEVAALALREYPTDPEFDRQPHIAKDSPAGAFIGLAARLAKEFGLVDHSSAAEKMLTDGWGELAWHVAHDIARLPWQDYIEARTGRKWGVNDGDFPI
jgi:hypothetical protein